MIAPTGVTLDSSSTASENVVVDTPITRQSALQTARAHKDLPCSYLEVCLLHQRLAGPTGPFSNIYKSKKTLIEQISTYPVRLPIRSFPHCVVIYNTCAPGGTFLLAHKRGDVATRTRHLSLVVSAVA